MKIIFSDHANLQLRKRKISKSLIKKAIINPQSTKLSYRGRELRRSLVNDKLLEVVVRVED